MQMKLSYVLIFFILSSCSDKPKRVSPVIIKLSTAQIFLDNLRDSLKAEYLAVDSETMKQAILDVFHERLQTYLISHPIDSINVTVDEVIVNGWVVATQFHHNDIQFKYQLTFMKNMTQSWDSLYKFMRGLKTGSDICVDFDFMGACRVNRPVNDTLPIFRIFAFPTPLAFGRK